MSLITSCEGARNFGMTFSGTQLTEKKLNICVEYFYCEFVKLILYGHTKFEDDSVPLSRSTSL